MATPTKNTPDLFGFVPAADATDNDIVGDTAETTGRKRPVPKRSATGVGASVTAITPSTDVLAAAQQLPANIRLGTSSWSFPGWSGLVYEGNFSETKLAREGLAAYAHHPLLQTVSIDRTFYAPLSERDFAAYAKQVPSTFQFVVKAPMAITSSYLRSETGAFSDSQFYLNADFAINEFIAPCSLGLQAQAGPLVFQFPPQGRRATAEPDIFINRLYRFLTKLPPGLLYAVELRDPQLLTPRFFKCLSTTATRFCVASHAKMPSPAEQIVLMNAHMPAGDFVCRWSLHAGFKYEDAKSRYFPFNQLVDEDIDSRTALAIAAASAAQAGYASFITINNKAEGSAPLSVLKLAQEIARKASTPNHREDLPA